MSSNLIDGGKGVEGTGNHSIEGVSLGRASVLQAEPGRHPAAANLNFQCEVRLNDCLKSRENSDFLKLNVECGDGGQVHVYRCGSKRCNFQKQFFPTDKVVSSATHRISDVIVPDNTVYLNCHSPNVIYLLTCNKCGMQYVGETCQKLNERINTHISNLKHSEKNGFCKILSTHFTSGLCKDAGFKVQLLEKLPGDGRTGRKAIDPSCTSFRKQRERFWMLKLRTVYPYGLNDRVGDEYKTADTHIAVGSKFPNLGRKHARLKRGVLRKGTNNLTPNKFVTDFKNHLDNCIEDTSNFIRVSLSSMKKSGLREVFNVLDTEYSTLPSSFPHAQWYLLIFDAIESKLYKPPKNKSKKKAPENICSIFFDNKAVEMINIGNILSNGSLKIHLNSCNKNFPRPMITYSLHKTISSKIFNFKQFVSDLDVHEFVRNPSSIPCNCEGSEFSDKHHKHIVTGDLRIVKSNKLRKLFVKGPKFRDKKPLDFHKAKTCIMSGLRDCVDKWCAENGVPTQSMTEWLTAVTDLVDERISILKTRVGSHRSESFLSDKSVLDELNKLHDTFVVVPIDKATGNVAIVCKRHYANVLIEELGFGNSTSNTYACVSDGTTDVDLINKNLNDLKSKFNIPNIDSDNSCLPTIYWLPKMHKVPSKARFIIAAPKCSIKPLSKAVTHIFKLFHKQIEAYNKKCQYFTGVNGFWVVQSNQKVTAKMKNINATGRAKSISTFDFSTLYTKIPHDKLISVLNSLIDFCFSGGGNQYISVTKYGARWVKDSSRCKLVFSKDKVKEAVAYLLDQCYFQIGKCLFRQIIGIPMGSDPAPFFANLFLYFYERKWILDLKKKDLAKARKFGSVFRFIDDLNVMNDDGIFEKHYREIYPPEMELSKENVGHEQASFLDLDIKIVDNKFSLGLYDKRDAFPFSIVRMPYKCSNMPAAMFYSTIAAEVLRIARATTLSNSFIVSVKSLLQRMFKQGANAQRTRKTLSKTFNRHCECFKHVSNNVDEFMQLILS